MDPRNADGSSSSAGLLGDRTKIETQTAPSIEDEDDDENEDD
jgi:hypothetical protein